MHILLVHCHPDPASFTAAVRDTAIATLQAAGHSVDLLDLYAENFEPVMSRAERAGYHERGGNAAPVAGHLARVKQAEALLFVYPTWWYGQPAMLKGWLDRVFIPHETFEMPEPGRPIRGLLPNIRLVGAITTLGSPKFWWWFMGMPGRRVLLTGIRVLCAKKCRTLWLGLHSIDSAGEGERRAFLERVKREMGRVG